MEVEIKARCDEARFPELRERLLALGAQKVKEKRQLDQYYNLPHKDLRGTKQYVRLRAEGESGVLAFHDNLNTGLTNEYEVKVSDRQMTEKILENFGLKKLGLIDKFREAFKLEDFEICLDKVAGIGTFIEVETDGNEQNWKEKQKECIQMLKKLGLDESSLTNEFLCDIATRK